MKDARFAQQLASLGLNPMMFGVQRDDLSDMPAERVRAYEEHLADAVAVAELLVKGKV